MKELVLDALLMPVWRRKPENRVTVHSDQGSQYTSYEWQEFLEANGLAGSTSRRSNCHDNAVAESFFQLLKRERIRKRVYLTRDIATVYKRGREVSSEVAEIQISEKIVETLILSQSVAF